VNDIAIKVERVSKTFKLPHEKQTSIKGLLINKFKGSRRSYERQKVLDNISFEIKKGEFFGIVGRNGSGKSTLLKMLAGIYTPTSGSIQIDGRLTPFIELGVGFNPELTGRENVFLNGALLGFSRKEMEAMYADIVTFAELERFMDQKLKNYSSGMQVRLAFSIAIRSDSPILLLDEVLAVGDALFQKKCYEYFKKLRHDKKTVILVSHDTGVLQEYCDKGILIEKGELLVKGSINDVISKYIKELNQTEEETMNLENNDSVAHVGSGRAIVESVVTRKRGKQSGIFTESEDYIHIITKYKFNEDIDNPIYGLTINDAAGARILAINNMWSNKKMTSQKHGKTIEIEWTIPNLFNSGTFYITPAIATAGGSEMLDQADDMTKFRISKKQFSNSATNVKYDMKILK
jgi:ABC-2 type transport system ATP-binding protein